MFNVVKCLNSELDYLELRKIRILLLIYMIETHT